jgi:tetratricopeptide (TPR) repeat protein
MHESPGPTPLAPAWKLAALACTALLACLPFLGALRGDFLLWDDDLLIVDNPHLRGLDAESLGWMFSNVRMAHYAPLTWLSYALDGASSGFEPRAFHRTALALHALNAGLVLLLAERVLRHATQLRERARWAAAALAAVLFGVHPLRTEPVAWISARPELLSTAGALASALAYLAWRERGTARSRWPLVSIACFGLGLLAKAGALALPLALLVLDVWPLKRFARREGRSNELREALREKLPHFVLAAAAGAGAFVARSQHSVLGLEDYGPLRRLVQAASGIVRYPLQTLAPVGLTPLVELQPDFDPLAASKLAALAGAVGVTALLFALRRRFPAALAAWCTYVVLVLPVSGLMQSGHQAAADRYSYLACVPFAVLVGGAAVGFASRARWRATWTAAVALIAVGFLAAASRAQTRVWHDSIALWQRVIDVDPQSYTGHWMLGVALHRSERFEEALAPYREAMKLRAGGADEDARYNLALSLVALGREDEAEAALLEVLQEHPTHLPSLQSLRELCQRRGKPELALKLCERAVHVDPGFTAGWVELAGQANRAGLYAQALAAARRAIELEPDNAAAQARAGLALLYLEQFPQAEERLRRAAELEPAELAVRVNLGVCLERLGRRAQARAEWAAVLALDPERADARSWMERTGGAQPP